MVNLVEGHGYLSAPHSSLAVRVAELSVLSNHKPLSLSNSDQIVQRENPMKLPASTAAIAVNGVTQVNPEVACSAAGIRFHGWEHGLL